MVYKAVLFAVVVVSLCGLHSASKFSDCGSADGSIVSVDVSDCPQNARRCTLKRNTNASLDISFTPSVDSDTLKAIVHGVILDVPVPFDLPNSDGCKDSGVECPLKAGQTYKYTAKLPILSSYPRMTVDIRWELQDAANKDIICALILAKIQ